MSQWPSFSIYKANLKSFPQNPSLISWDGDLVDEDNYNLSLFPCLGGKKKSTTCHCWTIEDGSSSHQMIIVGTKKIEPTSGICDRQPGLQFGSNLVRRLGLTEAVLVASHTAFYSSRGKKKMNSY